jgi:SAM-dependent methyltransferase
MGVAREDPDLRYLQHTSAGADYFREITALDADQRTRAAFCTLVLRIVPPGARLFDFGSGPGIDARFFAERGFAVDAYDVDPRMREFFAQHCEDLIETGNVTLDDCSYRDFLTRSAAGSSRRADLVIANFAPLNLVDDLHELFAKFHTLTGPHGKVLASVLNPVFFGEMRSRWWWRRAPRLWRDGELFLPGPQAPHYRRLLRHFSAASAPHFKLTRVFRELSPLPGTSNGVDLQRHRHLAWLHLARYRFSFLLFEKACCG